MTFLDTSEKRKKAIQDNEQKFGEEARALYGDEVVDATNTKLLTMDLSKWNSLEDLEAGIKEKLTTLLPTNDPTCPEARLMCAMHAKWIQGHWPEGLYSNETHLSLAQSYLADERFIAYYDNACGKGATKFLVEALKNYLA